MKKVFEMSEEDLEALYEACKPVPLIMVIGGVMPSDPQKNANLAWQKLGEKMGFDWKTARPVAGKSNRFFEAEATEVTK